MRILFRARRRDACGADSPSIHACHGYMLKLHFLVADFCSPSAGSYEQMRAVRDTSNGTDNSAGRFLPGFFAASDCGVNTIAAECMTEYDCDSDTSCRLLFNDLIPREESGGVAVMQIFTALFLRAPGSPAARFNV